MPADTGKPARRLGQDGHQGCRKERDEPAAAEREPPSVDAEGRWRQFTQGQDRGRRTEEGDPGAGHHQGAPAPPRQNLRQVGGGQRRKSADRQAGHEAPRRQRRDALRTGRPDRPDRDHDERRLQHRPPAKPLRQPAEGRRADCPAGEDGCEEPAQLRSAHAVRRAEEDGRERVAERHLGDIGKQACRADKDRKNVKATEREVLEPRAHPGSGDRTGVVGAACHAAGGLRRGLRFVVSPAGPTAPKRTARHMSR